MALNLPTEVDRDKFTEFLEEIKRDFPAGELFVQYQEVDNKVIGRLLQLKKMTPKQPE